MTRRERGTGSLFRPAGRQIWMARLYVPTLGRHKKRSTGTPDRQRAERFLAKWRADVLGGTWLPQVDKTTFADLAQMLRDDYQANHRRSQTRMEFALVHLTAAFGGHRARAIGTQQVLTYRVQRQEAGAKNATINRELATLKRMFRLGQIAGKTSGSRTSPCSTRPTPAKASSRPPTSNGSWGPCRRTSSPWPRPPT